MEDKKESEKFRNLSCSVPLLTDGFEVDFRF